MKHYTVELSDLGTLNQIFLDNIKTQKTILKKENKGQNCLKKL